MNNFRWTKEELADSYIIEEMYKTEKEFQKNNFSSNIMIIIFYPLFKILEMLNK